MTPQQLKAMKLALEALKLNNKEWKSLADSGDAGYWKAEDQDHYKQTEEAITALEEVLAEHAMQEVQRLGQEIEQEPAELCQYGQEPASCTSNPMDCQCAIDAALAQPEQEPVADDIASILACRDMLDAQPVPPRTWVGLTDDEKNDCLVSADPCEALAEPEARQLIEDVEQALKERNQ